ncbi:hypothetical protein [Pseudomonas fluorescens]|uniref:Uncharacterized protein n=1 Tax=Pseudomonas fluorescens TaxID=294 RepID=A0A4Y9T9W3_PSEFL|nr:hypothetical protein [Pseudomonas fluorescens]TFW40901.1 hypothetical protein E4T65_23935 [Pseudomonas fluorescens]
MSDHGLAGSEHYNIIEYGDAQGFEMVGVILRPGAYELIQAQLHLMCHAPDESVALRYFYQLEGVLLTLLRYEEISAASAEALREFFQHQLPAALAAMVSVP